MGRSAKLYKKKPKSKLNKRDDRAATVEGEAKREVVHARLQGKAAAAAAAKESAGGADAMEAQPEKSKLKSKVWKQLDAQRARSGLSEYSTPKQAGIDYMSQWGRRKAG